MNEAMEHLERVLDALGFLDRPSFQGWKRAQICDDAVRYVRRVRRANRTESALQLKEVTPNGQRNV